MLYTISVIAVFFSKQIWVACHNFQTLATNHFLRLLKKTSQNMQTNHL